MRDRAFADRCAARRASAAAKTMEMITSAESVIEMVRKYMEKYANCTEAFNTSVSGSLVDIVTGTVQEESKGYV